MYKNYLKTGWRNLLRSKVYSSINITGLAAGMTVAMLIGLFIWDELSFDSYFTNRSRLAQVMVNQTNKGITYTSPTVAMPLGNALRTQYAGDFTALSLTSFKYDHIVSVDDKSLSAPGMWVQPDFPEMFTLAMQQGRRDALKDPSTVLISASLAKALFGDTDPMDNSVRIQNRFDMNIGGVYEDLPHNTTFYNTSSLPEDR